eukprot:12788306-Heterocapsa_arctica.AAC.1
MDNWVRYLGRHIRRHDTGFDVKIPEDYIRSLLDAAGMAHCKAVTTPFAEKNVRGDDGERVLTVEEKA